MIIMREGLEGQLISTDASEGTDTSIATGK
jgi:hypothetical protein